MNADGGDKKSAYMSVAGGALSPVAKSVRGDGAASQAASSTGSLNRKWLMSQRNMENGGTRSVASMRWKMHAGLVALAVLASIIFAVSKTTLGDFSHLIDIIYHAGRRRYNVVSVGFHSRTVVLSSGLIVRHGADRMCSSSHTCGAIFQDAREKLMAAAQELQSINADLYDPTDPVKMFDRVSDIYDYPFDYTTNQVDLGPPPVNISVSYGLQALLVKYAGNGYACSQMPVTTLAKCAQLYCDDPVIWRFIQDSRYVALVGADTAVAAYVDQAFDMENQFKAVALGLLAVVIFLVFVLWTCVFWPAALSVQASNAGVLSISDSLPREAVRALIKRYTRLVQQLDALSQEVAGEGADDDAESDRGMDSDEEGGENGGEGGNSGGNDGSRADSRRHSRGDSSAHREEGSSSVGSDDSAERVDDQDLGGGSSGVYRHKAGTVTRDGKGTLSLAPSQHQQHGGGRAGTSARGAGYPLSATVPLTTVMENPPALGASAQHPANTPRARAAAALRGANSSSRLSRHGSRNVSFRVDKSGNSITGNNAAGNTAGGATDRSGGSGQGAQLAHSELDQLRRAGASASNLLDQMQDDSHDFAYEIAAATGGGGNDPASRSVRLAQAAQHWNDHVDQQQRGCGAGGGGAAPNHPSNHPFTKDAGGSRRSFVAAVQDIDPSNTAPTPAKQAHPDGQRGGAHVAADGSPLEHVVHVASNPIAATLSAASDSKTDRQQKDQRQGDDWFARASSAGDLLFSDSDAAATAMQEGSSDDGDDRHPLAPSHAHSSLDVGAATAAAGSSTSTASQVPYRIRGLSTPSASHQQQHDKHRHHQHHQLEEESRCIQPLTMPRAVPLRRATEARRPRTLTMVIQSTAAAPLTRRQSSPPCPHSDGALLGWATAMVVVVLAAASAKAPLTRRMVEVAAAADTAQDLVSCGSASTM